MLWRNASSEFPIYFLYRSCTSGLLSSFMTPLKSALTHSQSKYLINLHYWAFFTYPHTHRCTYTYTCVQRWTHTHTNLTLQTGEAVHWAKGSVTATDERASIQTEGKTKGGKSERDTGREWDSLDVGKRLKRQEVIWRGSECRRCWGVSLCVCVRVSVCVYAPKSECLCVRTWKCVPLCAPAPVHMSICVYVCAHSCLCMCACMHMCICVYAGL